MTDETPTARDVIAETLAKRGHRKWPDDLDREHGRLVADALAGRGKIVDVKPGHKLVQVPDDGQHYMVSGDVVTGRLTDDRTCPGCGYKAHDIGKPFCRHIEPLYRIVAP